MTATPSGIAFGPTGSGKYYLSSYEHRGANARKSQWAAHVAPTMEFDIFRTSDAQSWCDDVGHYWGVLDREAAILGTAGERIAKFPRNDSSMTPWHGYPVSPRLRGAADAPPYTFVEVWRLSGAITRTVARRLQRRKL